MPPFADPSPRPSGLGNSSGGRQGVPRPLAPPCLRGTPGPVFGEGRTLGPEPQTRPWLSRRPLVSGLGPALRPEQRVAEICLPRRLFTPSAWKASQRDPPTPPIAPAPVSAETREGRSAERPVGRGLRGLRRRLLLGGGLGVGKAGRRGPDAAQAPPRGRGRVGRWGGPWKRRAGRRSSHPSAAAKLGRAGRARCGRKGPLTPFSRRVPFGALSSRQVLCLEGDCQALRRVRPPPPPASTPSANSPFFLGLSLLFGWVITGSSCRARRGGAARPRVWGPSQQQPGRFPPASRPRPLPSGVPAWPWHRVCVFPLGQNFLRGLFTLPLPSTKREPGRLAHLYTQAAGDRALSPSLLQNALPPRLAP